MDKPLDQLTLENFRPAVGTKFALSTDGGGPIMLELVAARPIGSETAGERRRPFALEFRGPAGPVLLQATYRLEHDAAGPVAIFIVPVGRDGDGTNYEAIFT